MICGGVVCEAALLLSVWFLQGDGVIEPLIPPNPHGSVSQSELLTCGEGQFGSRVTFIYFEPRLWQTASNQSLHHNKSREPNRGEAVKCVKVLIKPFFFTAPNGSFQQLLQLQNGAERSHAEVGHGQQQPREGGCLFLCSYKPGSADGSAGFGVDL